MRFAMFNTVSPNTGLTQRFLRPSRAAKLSHGPKYQHQDENRHNHPSQIAKEASGGSLDIIPKENLGTNAIYD